MPVVLNILMFLVIVCLYCYVSFIVVFTFLVL